MMKRMIGFLLGAVMFTFLPQGAFAADPGLTVLYTGGINGWISGIKG